MAAAAALDDDYAYSYLYGARTATRRSKWRRRTRTARGSIAGEWYVVAGTQAASENLAGDCCRMKFTLGDGGATMSEWMWYEGDDGAGDGGGASVGYEWNFTGSVEYDGEAGVWYLGAGGYPAHSERTFWSTVYLVGSWGDARYFGWYMCGPSVAITRRGIPWVLSDDRELHSDEAFVSMIEAKLEALGMLKGGNNFTTYAQTDDCDYTWHHVASDSGERR